MHGSLGTRAGPVTAVRVDIYGGGLDAATDAMVTLVGAGVLPRVHHWEDLAGGGEQLRADVCVLIPPDSAAALVALRALRGRAPGCLVVLPPGSQAGIPTALEAGADAAVCSPCPPELLLAQVAAIVRLRRREDGLPLTPRAAWGWRFDEIARRIQPPGGAWTPVTPADAELLSVLFRDPEAICTLEDFSPSPPEDPRLELSRLRTRLSRLRHRLAQLSGDPLFENIHGQGYRLRRPGPRPTA